MSVQPFPFLFASVIGLILGSSHAAAQVADEVPVVVVVPIQGEITDSMVATLDRAIARAEERDAAYLLVEIDTPGGAVTTMEMLAGRLDASEVEPISYVTHEALSAGAFIALAGTRIYTNEQAQIGSSSLVLMIPGIGIIPPELDEGMKDIMEKQMSALRSKFRNRAEQHDRPGMASLAEAMVDRNIEVLLVQQGRDEIAMTRQEYEDLRRSSGGDPRILRTIADDQTLVNLTANEAFELGFTDGIVEDRAEVLDALGVSDAEVEVMLPNWSERMVGGLQGLRWWMIGIGILLLVVEFYFAPGSLVAGIVGATLIGIVMFSNYLVGLAELPEILLIILGVALIAIELFVIPGFGAFGIAGITCVALGVLFSFLPFLVPDSPVEQGMLKDAIRNFALVLVGAVVGVVVLSRVMVRRTPFLYRRMVLDTGATAESLEGTAAVLGHAEETATIQPGARGVANTDLRPAGKVSIGDLVLDARSEGGFISRGTAVVVSERAANHLVVRPATPDQGAREASP